MEAYREIAQRIIDMIDEISAKCRYDNVNDALSILKASLRNASDAEAHGYEPALDAYVMEATISALHHVRIIERRGANFYNRPKYIGIAARKIDSAISRMIKFHGGENAQQNA